MAEAGFRHALSRADALSPQPVPPETVRDAFWARAALTLCPGGQRRRHLRVPAEETGSSRPDS